MQDGLLPVSWNSVGFDFRVLHAHAQEHGLLAEADQIRTLVLNGVDPMFNFFMHKGFPIGLKRVASGFKLALNKTGSGEDAIDAWAQGGWWSAQSAPGIGLRGLPGHKTAQRSGTPWCAASAS